MSCDLGMRFVQIHNGNPERSYLMVNLFLFVNYNDELNFTTV
jgi:hypothetical protein